MRNLIGVSIVCCFVIAAGCNQSPQAENINSKKVADVSTELVFNVDGLT